MSATISKHQVDLRQCDDGEGLIFGYVAGDEGGFFFTWLEDLQGTLDSIEEDEVEGDGGLARSEVADYLRSYLPTTPMGRRKWGSDE